MIWRSVGVDERDDDRDDLTHVDRNQNEREEKGENKSRLFQRFRVKWRPMQSRDDAQNEEAGRQRDPDERRLARVETMLVELNIK